MNTPPGRPRMASGVSCVGAAFSGAPVLAYGKCRV